MADTSMNINAGALNKTQLDGPLTAQQEQIKDLISHTNYILQRVAQIADTLFSARPTDIPSGGSIPQVPTEPDSIQFLINRLGDRLQSIKVELDRF